MRLLLRTFALFAVLPYLGVLLLAITGTATWSGVAYVIAAGVLLAGLLTLESNRPRGLSRGAALAIVAIALLRICFAGEGRTVRMIDGARDDGSARFVNRVVDEGDVAIAGTRVLVASGALRDDDTELAGAMRSAYGQMRREEGSAPSPVVATLLGLERPEAFDLVLVDPPGQGSRASEAVVFLHGFAGNWDLPCWQIARAVGSLGVATACPSTRWVGDWGSPQGEATLRRTVEVLHARGIDRIVLAGLSNGGMGASELAPKMKGTFAGLVLISGAEPDAPPPGIPTLVLHGTRDTMVHVSSSRAYAKRTGAKLVELDAGHFAMLVRGAEADRAIREFVAARVTPRASR